MNKVILKSNGIFITNNFLSIPYNKLPGFLFKLTLFVSNALSHSSSSDTGAFGKANHLVFCHCYQFNSGPE